MLNISVLKYNLITRWKNSRQRRQLRKEIDELEAHLKRRDDLAVSRMLMTRLIGEPPHPYREPKFGTKNAVLLQELNQKNLQLEKLQNVK